MTTPRKGTARWIEYKLHEIADRLETDPDYEPGRAKAQIDALKNAYVTRISRAQQNRAGESIEDHLDDDERTPDLKLIDGTKAV